MGLLSHALTQVCSIQNSHIDKFGDIILDSISSVPCRFRYIDEVQRITNREGLTSDAMLWLEPTANVAEGTVIYVDSAYFRIQKITKARKLTGSTVHFLKCMLEAYYQVS